MPPSSHIRREELFHYTNEVALKSILTTNTLWATHFESLNDRTEIFFLKKILSETLTDNVVATLRSMRQQFSKHDRARLVRRGVEKLARENVEVHIATLYNVNLGRGSDKVPYVDPYITSFCNHGSDQAYERENGLLSQWRSYGGNTGYAIVFDRQQLEALLRLEGDTHKYTLLGLDDVVYGLQTDRVQQAIAPIIKLLTPYIVAIITRSDPPSLDKLFDCFTTASTTIKHRGFFEEREVRIVASPTSQAMQEKFSLIDPTDQSLNRSLKTIHRPSASVRKQYIALFDQLSNVRLPIKRIIVGPSADQRERITCLRRWLESVPIRVKVSGSETPYRYDQVPSVENSPCTTSASAT
jgi:hypothetical protein